MIKYGTPYQGSKSRIADWLVLSILPGGRRLCDLFAGGCAVSHAALLSGKYERVMASDISDSPMLFVRAVNGVYHDETRWFSRDDFDRLKGDDPYVRICWSFGTNGMNYMYSRTDEQYKKAIHHAVVYDDWDEFFRLCPDIGRIARDSIGTLSDTHSRRIALTHAVCDILKDIGGDALANSNRLYSSCMKNNSRNLSNLQHMERIENLERLESLMNLEALGGRNVMDMLDTSMQSYEAYEHRVGDVVYCDIPYRIPTSRKAYGGGFDHDRFYEWALSRDYPVYVSEYSMPDGFVCIGGIGKQNNLSSRRSFMNTERVFVQRRYAGEMYLTNDKGETMI